MEDSKTVGDLPHGGFNIDKIEGVESGMSTAEGGNRGKISSPKKEPAYDVALSYAGEDRGFVQAVYTALCVKDVSVFFDRAIDEEIVMWGENILDHLHEVYGTGKARYCVAFVSTA